MKTISIVAILVMLALSTGCTISNALFSMFGDHYSGGGSTQAEKKYHYNQQVEASRKYGSSLP